MFCALSSLAATAALPRCKITWRDAANLPHVFEPTAPPLPAGAQRVDYALDRTVAQWLHDHKLPFRRKLNGTYIVINADEPLPTEPFTVDSLWASPNSIPREELPAGIADFKRLVDFHGGYLPRAETDPWAEAFAGLATITDVNAYGSSISAIGFGRRVM